MKNNDSETKQSFVSPANPEEAVSRKEQLGQDIQECVKKMARINTQHKENVIDSGRFHSMRKPLLERLSLLHKELAKVKAYLDISAAPDVAGRLKSLKHFPSRLKQQIVRKIFIEPVSLEDAISRRLQLVEYLDSIEIQLASLKAKHLDLTSLSREEKAWRFSAVSKKTLVEAEMSRLTEWIKWRRNAATVASIVDLNVTDPFDLLRGAHMIMRKHIPWKTLGDEEKKLTDIIQHYLEYAPITKPFITTSNQKGLNAVALHVPSET